MCHLVLFRGSAAGESAALFLSTKTRRAGEQRGSKEAEGAGGIGYNTLPVYMRCL